MSCRTIRSPGHGPPDRCPGVPLQVDVEGSPARRRLAALLSNFKYVATGLGPFVGLVGPHRGDRPADLVPINRRF